MGYTTSTVHGIEVPDSAEANNVPEDIGKVVTALEAGSIVKRLTSAQIAALTAPQKPAGLVVYNTTTSKVQISDGTNFRDVGPMPYAELVRSTNQSLANNTWTKVTYGSSTDPSGIGNTGTGVITLAAGVWALSFSGTMEAGVTAGTAAVIYVNSIIRAMQPYIVSGFNPAEVQVSTVIHTTSSVSAEAWMLHAAGSSKSVAAARFTAVRIA